MERFPCYCSIYRKFNQCWVYILFLKSICNKNVLMLFKVKLIYAGLSICICTNSSKNIYTQTNNDNLWPTGSLLQCLYLQSFCHRAVFHFYSSVFCCDRDISYGQWVCSPQPTVDWVWSQESISIVTRLYRCPYLSPLLLTCHRCIKSWRSVCVSVWPWERLGYIHNNRSVCFRGRPHENALLRKRTTIAPFWSNVHMEPENTLFWNRVSGWRNPTTQPSCFHMDGESAYFPKRWRHRPAPRPLVSDLWTPRCLTTTTTADDMLVFMLQKMLSLLATYMPCSRAWVAAAVRPHHRSTHLHLLLVVFSFSVYVLFTAR